MEKQEYIERLGDLVKKMMENGIEDSSKGEFFGLMMRADKEYPNDSFTTPYAMTYHDMVRESCVT